jgi:hypothetical protein
MADTDTVFPVGTVSRLIDSGKQIISGLVMVDSSPPIPMMYRRLADVGFGIGMFSAITEWDEKIIKVDSVGAGCLMVHRDVYIDIESRLSNRAAPWFQESVVGTQLIGEDFTFCMRAASIGYSIFVNTSVFVGHVKTRVLRADSRQ